MQEKKKMMLHTFELVSGFFQFMQEKNKNDIARL